MKGEIYTVTTDIVGERVTLIIRARNEAEATQLAEEIASCATMTYLNDVGVPIGRPNRLILQQIVDECRRKVMGR